MEEKQLDFNRPLLSVRRFSSAASTPDSAGGNNNNKSVRKIPPIPVYRSELKSGPVCHPGTVPFQWEKMPGRPKNERKTQITPSSQHPPIPKLPPGKIIRDEQRHCKREKAKQSQMGNVYSTYQMVPFVDKHTTKDKRSHDEMQERSSSSDDDDDTYLDALDSLSRNESFLNCSVNGLSGVDGAEVKPYGTFTSDAQTKNFMMDRFLPAAKAMASELPEYATRKQLVVKAPKEVDQVGTAIKGEQVQQRRRMVLLHHMQNEVRESDDESDDFEEHDYLSAKLCGLFPRLFLKSCVMNPAPGLRMQAGAKISSVHTVQAKINLGSSCCRNVSKLPVEAAHQQRSKGGNQRTDLNGDKLNQLSDHQRSEKSSLCWSIIDLDASQYPNQPSQTVKKNVTSTINDSAETAEFSRENGLNSQRKRRSSFRELLASEPAKCEEQLAYPAVEKTLYIDAVYTGMPKNSISSVSSTKKGTTNYKADDLVTLVKNVKTDNSSFNDTELNPVDSNRSPSPKTLSSESSVLSLVLMNEEMQRDTMKTNFSQPNLLQDTTILEIPQLQDSENISSDIKSPQEADKRSCHALSSKLSLPPLPKSPSESWLHRTLPAASVKNSSSRSSSNVGKDVKIQASKTPLTPKWENMVRTSTAHHKHMLFSEERLTVIPEDSI